MSMQSFRNYRDRRILWITSVADDVVWSAIMVSCICGVFFPPFFSSLSTRYRSYSLVHSLIFISSHFSPLFSVWAFLSSSHIYRANIHTCLSLPFSIFLSCAWKTLRCILSIFKRYGPSVRGSASIYKASGSLLFSAAFSRRTLVSVVGQQQALASYGFVTESILYTAFYLRVPILCTFSFRSFAIFIFIHFRLSRSFLYYFAYKCISSLVSFSSFSSPPLSAAALSSSVVTWTTAGGCSLAYSYS